MKKRNKKKFILKIFAVIFSFVIWFYVLSSTSVILKKDIRVNYILPKGYSLASNVPAKLVYKLKGPRAIINELVSKAEVLDIDLAKKFNSNNRRFNLSYLSFSKKFPFSVKTLDISPKSIQIYLVKNSIKTVPIKVSTIYSTSDEVSLDKIFLSDKTVKVYGAKSVLKDIEYIDTDVIDLSTISSNTARDLKLVVPDIRVSLKQSSVNAKIKIKKDLNLLEILDVPIKFDSIKPVISSSLKTVDLIVSSKKEISKEQTRSAIAVRAKILDDRRQNHTVILDIDLPEGVSLIKSSVSEIKVKTGIK